MRKRERPQCCLSTDSGLTRPLLFIHKVSSDPARRLGVSSLVAFQAADDEVCDKLGVLGDRFGVERVGGVEVAGEGDEREERGAAVCDQEMERAQRDGSGPSAVARWWSSRSIGASAGWM
jgi:hypothetical protein